MSLYRLPCSCHAGSLIPAVRFFRKEKSSTLRAGDSLRRTEISAQTLLDAETSCPPCIPLLTKRRGDSERSTSSLLAESMSVTEHARDILRRTFCAARGAEFFLYEKMGRRAIVSAGSISEAGTEILHPHNPKKMGIQGDESPWQSARQRLAALPCGDDQGFFR